MKLTNLENEQTLLLELPEELGISQVAELKEALQPAAEKGWVLRLDASRLDTTHTALLQLLMVWKKSGRRLDLANPSVEMKNFSKRLGQQ